VGVDEVRQPVPRPAEHISSEEWKRFEMRMRRRRVERLIARAEAALAEGNKDEVTKTLDEARQLDPSLKQILALENALALQEPAPVIETPQPDPDPVVSNEPAPRHIRKVAVAAAAVTLAIGGTELWIIRGPVLEHLRTWLASEEPAQVSAAVPAEPPEPLQPPRPDQATSSTHVQVETVEARSVQPPQLLKQHTNTSDPPSITAPPNPPPAPVSQPVARAVPIATTGPPNALAEVREPKPALPRSSEAPGPRPAEAPAVPAVNMMGDAAPAEVRTVGAAGAPEPNIASPKADHPARDVGVPASSTEDGAVRGVLNKYAAAYSRLDASAAQEVWPAVNRSALERAFDSLASQQLLLDHCNVDVRGATARATCAGSTTWSPKIGNSSRRTEARNWTFQLAKAGSAWQIVSARVQNR
jgi:hypothetical protein